MCSSFFCYNLHPLFLHSSFVIYMTYSLDGGMRSKTTDLFDTPVTFLLPYSIEHVIAQDGLHADIWKITGLPACPERMSIQYYPYLQDTALASCECNGSGTVRRVLPATVRSVRELIFRLFAKLIKQCLKNQLKLRLRTGTVAPRFKPFLKLFAHISIKIGVGCCWSVNVGCRRRKIILNSDPAGSIACWAVGTVLKSYDHTS